MKQNVEETRSTSADPGDDAMPMSNDLNDIYLCCRDCHSNFVVTYGEQQFYEARSLEFPKRCKPCRASRRKMREAGEHPSMRQV